MSLISIAKEDLSPGIPLPWEVFDQDGNTLLEEGAVIESEEQLQALLASNPLRELCWVSGAAASSPDNDEFAGEDFEVDVGDTQQDEFRFEDMRLRVGDRIQLQPPATVSLERHVVRLIGYLENATLLVTSPMVNGLRVQLRENDTIVARIFSSQKAFGFSCTVERVCRIPYDYIHLSFPVQIQGAVIRKSPRVRTRIITSIAGPAAADSNDRYSGIIVNLSADGALIKVRQPLFDVGQVIQLSFRVNLHKVDAYLTVSAVIRSVFDDEEKNRDGSIMSNYGVQFQDLLPNDSVILQSLIYQQMVEQPHSLT
jgi:hypothetical protein